MSQPKKSATPTSQVSAPGAAIDRLLAVMRRLRDPQNGCPWDIAQDFATIAPYTIEEAYEVADAIAHGDREALCAELGDLLFQVVFHAEMARQRGWFDFAAVAAGIAGKMERRHPHVFGDETVENAAEQSTRWEAMKAAERRAKAPDPQAHSLLDGIPRGLPELSRAVKLQQRAARVGFDWKTASEILTKLDEETGELQAAIDAGEPEAREDELGDVLFVIANLARRLEVDPGSALRRANLKFERRFRAMEKAAGERLAEMTLEEMEALWQDVKKTIG